MRVVLFDAILESHVTESLARAFRAAGHEVLSTGRLHHGHRFRTDDALARTLEPHLAAVRDFRPDWVIVFRPATAPWPVLRLLRGTGAQLAVWLSDDPVLFEHSYGPVIDLYDLVMHCGDARVLRFHEERAGRPTGVNIPFWTDHTAFPRVHGALPAEADVLFLGNVTGPVRRRRYEQLAAMESRVRIHGAVGDDPAGLGGGYLDTDAEVVAAAARVRTALNIPQVFADHRGTDTWFPGLDRLGSFEVPSRVVQYAALGLPTVTVDPTRTACASLPEQHVVPDVAAADAWVQSLIRDDGLAEAGERMAARFDRSFCAAARVLAFESLVADDSWRRLDAQERATWFLQFDGRTRPSSADGEGSTSVPAPTSTPAPTPVPPTVGGGVVGRPTSLVLVAAQAPPRFSALDVLARELRDRRPEASVRVGAEAADLLTALPPRPGRADTHGIDVDALLAGIDGGTAPVLVCGEGAWPDPDGAARLRAAGGASILVLRSEAVNLADLERFDLVVGVGPAAIAQEVLVRALPRGVMGQGLVESAFLDALRTMPVRPGAVVVGSAGDPLALAPDGVGAPDVLTPRDAAEADVAALAELLSRDTVLLEPTVAGARHIPSALTPYALCAGAHVVARRHRSPTLPRWYRDEVRRAADAGEARARRDADAADPAQDPGLRLPRQRWAFAAAAQLDAWCAAALGHAAARHDDDVPASAAVLRPEGAVTVAPGAEVRLDDGWGEAVDPARGTVRIALRLGPDEAVRAVTLTSGGATVRAVLPGDCSRADLVLRRADLTAPGGAVLTLAADPTEPLPRQVRLTVAAEASTDPAPPAAALDSPLIVVRPGAPERRHP